MQAQKSLSAVIFYFSNRNTSPIQAFSRVMFQWCRNKYVTIKQNERQIDGHTDGCLTGAWQSQFQVHSICSPSAEELTFKIPCLSMLSSFLLGEERLRSSSLFNDCPFQNDYILLRIQCTLYAHSVIGIFGTVMQRQYYNSISASL